tara:strand:+ start:573 stop:755 length:183 start_codon:yes stop_codon:yes gene_type:complete
MATTAKKVKLVDETADENLSPAETKMQKTLEAMDWKLWEMYQTSKRIEKYLGITPDENDE